MSLRRSRDRFQPRSQRLAVDGADDDADLVVGLAFAPKQSRASDAAFAIVHVDHRRRQRRRFRVVVHRHRAARGCAGRRREGRGRTRRGVVVTADLLDHYRRASEWTLGNVRAVADLDAGTPCDEWSVRDLLNHMLATQRYFIGAARGEDASPPGPTPPNLLSDDPVADFERGRAELLATYSQDGVAEKTGPALGIAFADQLLHGWDLARATDQDTTMPDGLAGAAYDAIHGRFTDEQRPGIFKPEISVGDDATPQQRLLAYTGRNPT